MKVGVHQNEKKLGFRCKKMTIGYKVKAYKSEKRSSLILSFFRSFQTEVRLKSIASGKSDFRYSTNRRDQLRSESRSIQSRSRLQSISTVQVELSHFELSKRFMDGFENRL